MENTQPLWPAIAMLCMEMLSLLLSIRDHGKPKTGKDSAFTTVIAIAITTTLLYAGGFFDTLISKL